MAILNDAFFLAQQPVIGLGHDFSIDGTCFSTVIKANWESAKDEILVGGGKQFEKAVLAAGRHNLQDRLCSDAAANASSLRPLFNHTCIKL